MWNTKQWLENPRQIWALNSCNSFPSLRGAVALLCMTLQNYSAGGLWAGVSCIQCYWFSRRQLCPFQWGNIHIHSAGSVKVAAQVLKIIILLKSSPFSIWNLILICFKSSVVGHSASALLIIDNPHSLKYIKNPGDGVPTGQQVGLPETYAVQLCIFKLAKTN